ncbi:MAG: hypothetical protein KTR35_05335 [Gammaproteobacteria bacterium]|nr:hypothetical protein [Gammaproteobacteria bacterium]
MKWVKVFALFAVIHMAAWVVVHGYLKQNPTQILLVADTSFSLKSHFPDMQRWIEGYAASKRYSTIEIGTDKAMLGPLDEIKDPRSIFRTAFGKSSEESLQRYSESAADKRILLSDGSYEPSGWEVVSFN